MGGQPPHRRRELRVRVLLVRVVEVDVELAEEDVRRHAARAVDLRMHVLSTARSGGCKEACRLGGRPAHACALYGALSASGGMGCAWSGGTPLLHPIWIGGLPAASGHQPSTISQRPSAIRHQPSASGQRPSVRGASMVMLGRRDRAIRSHQKPPEAIRSHQKPSEAIRSHQKGARLQPLHQDDRRALLDETRAEHLLADVTKRLPPKEERHLNVAAHVEPDGGGRGVRRVPERSQQLGLDELLRDPKQSEAIRGHQRRSEAIRSNHKPSKAIRSNQRPPEAIRSHQRRSEAIRTRLDELLRDPPEAGSSMISGQRVGGRRVRGAVSLTAHCAESLASDERWEPMPSP